ncbi:MAG: hypothetical protein WAW96_00680 [Alphaproteobacteria bacterium]
MLTHGAEERADRLVVAILDRLKIDDQAVRSLNDAGLKSSIQRAIAHDFAVDDTVVLDGWVLSQTEARLCALATL